VSYIYKEPENIDKNKFLKVIASGVTTLMCDAIVGAAYSINDYDWLLQQYVSLLKHTDLEVREVAITCIGHLARLNEDANKNELLGILVPLLSDNDLAGGTEDAIDDVNIFS